MAAKRRPSFSPEPAKPAGAAAAHTDWVYRSDTPAPARVAAPATSPRTPAAQNGAPRAPRPRTGGRRRPGVDKTAGLLTPLALVHLVVLSPVLSCLRRLIKAKS